MNAESSFSVDAEPKVPHSASMAWLKKRRWFVVFVIVPTALAAIYFGLFASDVYVSESRFVIKSPDQKSSQMSTLANLIQTTGLSGGQEQTNEVLAFTRSRDALKSLEENPGFRARFSVPSADFLSRFPGIAGDASFEDLYKYYGKMVTARLDTETGTALITVKAFTAEDAYKINLRLLQLSENLVNRLNTRAKTTGIGEAQRQARLASDRVRTARIALAGYRNAQALIDPGEQAAGVIEIANNLISQRAALLAQLDLVQRMTPRNPSIPALKSQISALSSQIASQDIRVVGSSTGIASKMGGYEALLVEQEFATENLNVANAALVQARAQSQKQQFYLERVVEPNLPDKPMLPKRLLDTIVVAAAATFLYFIGWMLIVGIIEHAPED